MSIAHVRLGTALLLLSAGASGNPVQSPESIRDAARDAALAALAVVGGELRIDAVQFDARLRLAACAQPLQARVDGVASARLIAIVACDGPVPWSLRVPVQAQAIREVAVAALPIARNDILDKTALRIESRNVLTLPRGYFADLDAVIGQQATRAIRPGTVLAPGAIAPARLVRRGERVTVTAGTGAIAVRSEGIALADGAQGQHVSVRNPRSGRVVETEVVAYGTVAALP